MKRKNNKKIIVWVLALLAITDLMVWYQIVSAKAAASENSRVYFLDVGQGDSELIVLPGGAKILIDGGRPDGKVLTALAETLPAHNRYIDLLVMTHPQLDHFGGFLDVLKNYEIGAFIGNGRKGESDAYRALMDEIVARGTRYIQLQEGDRILYGDRSLSVLSPNSKNLLSGELNDTSLVMMLDDGGFRALFTADIGFNVENELMKKYDLSADILKVGHHGSRFSSGVEFLKAVNPGVAIIEVGKNTYGHPTPAALARLKSFGAQIFTTLEQGTISSVFSGGVLKLIQQ